MINIMLYCQFRLLLRLPLTLACWSIYICSFAVTAAEEALTILTIEGDLLGRIETLDEGDNPALVIGEYYSLLNQQDNSEVESLRLRLVALIPDRDVAFAAADSSELTDVMNEIDGVWTTIQRIHARNFTAEVVKILNQAYDYIFAVATLSL